MEFDFKDSFNINEDGTSYSVPVYRVLEYTGLVETDGELDVLFVRGSKLGEDNVEPRIGTLHEHLLSVMIHDLKLKNKLVPARETSIAITKLEEARHWLWQRQIDRIKRNVDQTYKK